MSSCSYKEKKYKRTGSFQASKVGIGGFSDYITAEYRVETVRQDMHTRWYKTDDSGGTKFLPKRTKNRRPTEQNERCKLTLTVRVNEKLDLLC